MVKDEKVQASLRSADVLFFSFLFLLAGLVPSGCRVTAWGLPFPPLLVR